MQSPKGVMSWFWPRRLAFITAPDRAIQQPLPDRRVSRPKQNKTRKSSKTYKASDMTVDGVGKGHCGDGWRNLSAPPWAKPKFLPTPPKKEQVYDTRFNQPLQTICIAPRCADAFPTLAQARSKQKMKIVKIEKPENVIIYL